MCRVWSLILMICIVYQINQTGAPHTHTNGGSSEISHHGQEGQPSKPTTSTSRHPDLGRPGGEPSRETTKHSSKPRKKPTTEHSTMPQKKHHEKFENEPMRDPSNTVVRLGVFRPEKGKKKITEEECKLHCETHFGRIISNEERIDIAIPKLINSDTVCRCELNIERLEPILKDEKQYAKDKKHRKANFSNFIDAVDKNRYGKFCAAKHWLSTVGKMKVEIGYESDAKDQKPLTRHQNPNQTPDRTLGSDSSTVNTRTHHQDANRTPNRDFVPPGDSRKTFGEVLLGTFQSTGEAFTERSCANRCLHTFGQLFEEDSQSWKPITEKRLSRDGEICDCLLYKDMVWKGCSYLRKKIKIDCNEVIQAFLNFDFCEGKLHAQKNHFDIVLGYEYNAVPHEREKNIIHPLEEVPLDDKPEEASAKHVNGDKNIVFTIPEKEARVSLFTDESCTKKCNTLFGYVILFPGEEKTTFTEGRLSGDRRKCQCFLNASAFEKRLVEIKKENKEEDKQEATKEDRKAFNKFLQECTFNEGYKWAVKYFTRRPELKVTVEIGSAIDKSDRHEILEEKKKFDEAYAKKLIDGKLKMATFTRSLFTGKLTLKRCSSMCNSKFGFIRAPRFPFTKPELSKDPLSCECWFNTEEIKEHLIDQAVSWSSFVAHLEKGYESAVKYLADYEPVREEEEDKTPFWEVLDMPEEAKKHRKSDENNNLNEHQKPDENNEPNEHDKPKHGAQKPTVKNWPNLHIDVVDEKGRPKLKGSNSSRKVKAPRKQTRIYLFSAPRPI
nr:PREDICTED: uncharacterized protein LOC109033414 isoform X1 [Bemisia tabaci]